MTPFRPAPPADVHARSSSGRVAVRHASAGRAVPRQRSAGSTGQFRPAAPTPARNRPASASRPSGTASSGIRTGRRRTAGRRRRPRRRAARLFGWLLLAVAVVLVVAAYVPGIRERAVAALGRGSAPVTPPQPPAGQPPSPAALSVPTAGPARPAPRSEAPVLRLPGSFPSSGSGTFSYASGSGEVIGRTGSLQRFRVAVEQGSGEDVAAFAEAVDATLADPRSWTGSGQLRLQRVDGGASHDFTVYLTTARTAGQMCLRGGVDIRIGGRPYTSCRAPGKVIINLDRWRLSADHLVDAGLPLAEYRRYVINHEVGHQLGRGHEQCPGRGKRAPVMQQQTLFLDGCRPNSWPYPDKSAA